MRLKCIKLTGFKSFVDNTTVSFPGNMCGVVGPNGCGKSNIIDAVRWVMGESSAKNLRGESMMDVIFKGSKTRKTSGYAQVELIFDNNEGRITGEYAAYTEISVKRRLTSDAQNNYFLNGSKCRRRDIMDIFLGTGLGPRSYSIISQGMISGLIESKPEELRVFIEEAAGISKYKERRREAENRIRRTTENLARLNDLREELDKRLSHLKRQAETAEKYKTYKEEERQKQAQLYALRWRTTNDELQAHELMVGDCETEMEAAVSKQVSGDTQIEQLRIERHENSDQFQKVQSLYYKTGNEITRLEQQITHQQEKEQQLTADLQESESLLEENIAALTVDKEALAQIETEQEELQPVLEEMQEQELEHQERLLQAEDAMLTWQKKWDSFNEQHSKIHRDAEVAQSGIQHTEQVLNRFDEQVRQYQDELHILQSNSDAGASGQLADTLSEQEALCETLATQCEEAEQQTEQCRQQIETLFEEKQHCYQLLNEAKGKKASLIALQDAALNHGKTTQKWLKNNHLENEPRLTEKLTVAKEWEAATETVLGNFLQSVTVNNLQQIAETVQDGDNINLSFIDCATASVTSEVKQSNADSIAGISRLEEYIQGVEHHSLFNSVFAAPSLKEALALLPHLLPHESVITPQAIWMGKGWLRVARDKDVTSGVLARQQALKNTEQELLSQQDKIQQIQDKLSEAQSALQSHEQKHKEIIQELSENNRRFGELKAELHAQQQRLKEENLRCERLNESIVNLKEQYAFEQEKLTELRLTLQESLDKMEQDSDLQETLKEERTSLQQTLEHCRQYLHDIKDQSHSVALKKQALDSRYQAGIQAVERLQTQQERLSERINSLKDSLAEDSDQDELSIREALTLLLEQQAKESLQMQEARTALETTEEKLLVLERNRSTAENEVKNIRSNLEQLRMKGQAMQIRCTTLTEQLTEHGFDLDTVVKNLPEEASDKEWEQALEKLSSRIAQLGAINLAAIEEYEQQSERLHYLNEQNSDLEEALKILEQAIERIDTETCSRFEMTFNQINEGLKDLFPRVFGGGQAYIEKTGDDLLNTGVTIMAQPPGKKNSTIHLLSGGEKALTAIALVFAIFRLNPSPFCMLDEVDAPLDDANVGRYVKMVREMSAHVQFIYVTHNKIAMEAANQLIGITMHEPGVSRPVSVDVDAAAEMSMI